MKVSIWWALLAFALLVVATGYGVGKELDRQEAERRYKQERGLKLAAVAEAETARKVDSVQVVKYVARTQWDTLNIHDTLEVRKFLWRVDTLRTVCMACTASASNLSTAGADMQRFQDSVIQAHRPRFRDRFGVTVGYGITKDGTDVKIGPQVGVTVRVWP